MKDLILMIIILCSTIAIANADTFTFKIYNQNHSYTDTVIKYAESDNFGGYGGLGGGLQQQLMQRLGGQGKVGFTSTNMDNVVNPSYQAVECGSHYNGILYFNSSATNYTQILLDSSDCNKLERCIKALESNNINQKKYFTKITFDIETRKITDINWSNKCNDEALKSQTYNPYY